MGGVTTVVRVAYLGPAGTHSERAAREWAPTATMVPLPTIREVVRAVEVGNADQGVVPLENSLEGVVTHTADVLPTSGLRLCGEVVLPVRHCLLAKRGTWRARVRRVYSHPQALAQCREWLARHVGGAVLVPSMSTASAVDDMLATSAGDAAAVAGRYAAGMGIDVLDVDIGDAPCETRFGVVAITDSERTGRDRTSLWFEFAVNEAGVLHGALGEFAGRGINMLKVESRPDRRNLGRYVFMVDVEGHRSDQAVREALEGIKARTSRLVLLGSYPRAT